VKTNPLRDAADAAERSGVGAEAFYAEWVKLARPEDRELVGRVANLDREYTAFVRRTGDAVEWLLGQQATTDEPIDIRESEIVKRAAAKFRVTAEGIEIAFAGVRSAQEKYLKTRGLAIKRSV
jgi:hypothetical protein